MEGYILKINFYTDGDFGCSHTDMKFDSDYGYTLFKIWKSTEEQVILKVISLLKEIKDSLRGKDYVLKYVTSMFDKAIENIKNQGYCYEEVLGNQDGTDIEFYYGEVDDEKSNIILSLTQEEYTHLLKNFDWVENKIIDITKIKK